MKEKNKSRMLPRNIVINTVMILIPIAILILLLVRTYVEEGVVWYADNERLSMQQTRSDIENVMEEFAETAQLITTDQEITPFQIQKESYGLVYAIKKLNHYRANISDLKDMIICLDGSDQIYRSLGKENFDTFAESVYLLKNTDKKQQLKEFMNGKENFGILMPDAFSPAAQSDYILVAYPLTSNLQQQYGTLVGMFERDFFDKKLISSGIDSVTFLCSGTGSLIYSSNGQAEELPEILKGLLESYSAEESFYPLTMGDQEYMVILSRSELTNWYYLRMIPYEALEKAFYSSKGGLLILLVAAVLVLSAVLGTLVAVYHYFPIRSLYRLFSGNVEMKEKRNELMLLNDYICDLQSQYRSAEKKLADMGRIQVREILKGLLRGSRKLSESDREALAQHKITGQQAYHIVVLSGQREEMEFGSLALEEELIYLESESLFFIMQEPQDYFVLLHSVSADADETEKAVTQLCEQLARAGFCLRAGIGRAEKQIGDLNESLNEAFLALEVDQQNMVVVFDKLLYSRVDEPFWYPLRDEFLLRLAIRGGQKGEILEKLKVLQETLRRSSHRYREYELRSILYRIMNYAMDLPGASDQHLREAMKQMADYRNPEDFFEAFETYIISEAGERKKTYAVNEVKGRPFQEILKFINENYCKPEMSLVYVAEQFGFGSAYLSKIFKDNMGVNFGDYLSEKRMERGRQLLVETQMSLQQIVESLGYSDVPSFHRKFSKKYGMSPGNYRKSMK